MLDTILDNLVLYLHLTLDCNMNCKYCYSGPKKKDIMPLEYAQKTIDFFFPHTKKLTIRFIGGEPLLQIDLLKNIVLYAEQEAKKLSKKLSNVIITNGTLFNEEFAQFCTKHKIEVSLSFDGLKECQDCNRVYPDGHSSFDDVFKNIPLLLRHNPYTHVVHVVSPNNVSLLADSIAFLFEHKLCNITLSPDYTNKQLKDFLPQIKEQYFKIADLYLKYRKQGHWAFLNIFESAHSQYYDSQRCQLGISNFSIDPHGTIYPCCNFVDKQEFPLGDIIHGWDDAKIKYFQETLQNLDRKLEEEHKNCPDTSRCLRRCGCTNLVSTGKLDEIDPVLCEYGKVEEEVRNYVMQHMS